MFHIMPREDVFFELFNQAAVTAHETARALQDLLEDFTDIKRKVQRIKDLEHEGDRIAHETFDQIAKTFITPLDREDIHAIASRLDDIIDMTDTAANRMLLYKITEPTEYARALGRVLVRATGLLVQAVALLHDFKQAKDIQQLCIAVNTEENEGDRIHHQALAALFENETSAVDIVKWKDIYQLMESATDMCEDAANVMQSVLVKNS